MKVPSTKDASLKTRMLFLSAAPWVYHTADGEQLLQLLDREADLEKIKANCRDYALEVHLEIASASRLNTIFSANTTPFHILHFSYQDVLQDDKILLLLENDAKPGFADPQTVEELGDLLGQHPCQLAVLIAPHSVRVAPILLALGVENVVAIGGNPTSLPEVARIFCPAFYRALLSGQTIANAFKRGKLPVKSYTSIEFLLLPSHDSAHHQPLNPQPREGTPWILREDTNLEPNVNSHFVGRRHDLSQIIKLLGEGQRCIAIHGFGGIGKTALATAVALWQYERKYWVDGVYIVELPAVESAARARAVIARALNLEFDVDKSDLVLARLLQDKQMLIVLDDVDELRRKDESGLITLLNELLSSRSLRLLITGRDQLPNGVRQYFPFRLPQLDRVDADQAFRAYAPPIEKWGAWQQSDRDLLLKQLDGYPLGIKLAGSYMWETDCGLLGYLDEIKARPSYQSPEEHLFRSLEISFQALPPAAQKMWPLLALFPAGLDGATAKAVFGTNSVQLLNTIVSFSMAERQDVGIERRYRLLEPARRYAERLLEGQDLRIYWRKLAIHFCEILEKADALYKENESSHESLRLFDLERLNIEAGWQYAVGQTEDVGMHRLLLKYGLALLNIADFRYNIQALYETFTLLLKIAIELNDNNAMMHFLNNLGIICIRRNKYSDALKYWKDAINITKKIGDLLMQGIILKNIGNAYSMEGESNYAWKYYRQASKCFEKALKTIDNKKIIGREQHNLYFNMGVQAFREAKFDMAIAHYREVLPHFVKGSWRYVVALGNLIEALLEKDNLAAATIELAEVEDILKPDNAVTLSTLDRAYLLRVSASVLVKQPDITKGPMDKAWSRCEEAQKLLEEQVEEGEEEERGYLYRLMIEICKLRGDNDATQEYRAKLSY